MKKPIIAILLWLTLCASARAEFMTGNHLLANMKSESLIERAVAMGYVQGVYDAGQRVVHCAPAGSGITVGQIFDLVRTYLEYNPVQRNYTADSLTMTVFSQAWPCPDKPKNSRNTL